MATLFDIVPAGNTVFANVGTTSTAVFVPSLVPVTRYYITNTSSNPVQVKISTNLVATTTAVMSTAGSPQLGPVIGGGDDIVMEMPTTLVAGTGTNGFVSNIQFGLISTVNTGSGVYITPIQ
jgi:hypothetical protein